MEFLILGPLEVRDRGRPVELGPAKQRALLAILLLERGRTVTVGRLIEGVWGEQSPPSAVKSVQAYVSRLRKALGDGLIETRGAGYAVPLADHELDLTRFEHVRTNAREQAGRADWEGAAATLREALELWRGPALADLAHEPFAAAEQARIEELRLSALEERLDADLQAGRHAALVAELDALVREHPLRERFRGQLMLALHRSGRSPEALDMFRAGRRVLVEQLGLEPGRALRDLEQQILRHAPELEAPQGRAVLRSRGSKTRLLVVALAGAAAAAGAVVGVTRGDAARVRVVANSVVAIDTHTNRVVADVPVGSTPSSVAVGGGSVWVVNFDDQTISEVDAATRRIVRTFAVGAAPGSLAYGAGSVWVTGGSDRLYRVDPGTDTVGESIRLRLDDSPIAGLAVSRDAVWVSSQRANVGRVDIATNRLVATVRTLPGTGLADKTAIVVDHATVWIASAGGERLYGLDSGTRRVVARRAFGAYAGLAAVSAGFGSIWVADEVGNVVWEIDPAKAAVVRAISVGAAPSGIAVGGGAVWTANSSDGTVSRIDPLAGTVRTLHVSGTPRGIAASRDLVWVTIG